MRSGFPAAGDKPERLEGVLAAVYAAYGTSWDAVPGADNGPHDLVDETLFLCRLVVAQLPDEPEPKGLLALMLYFEAHRAAYGGFVPLNRQDARLSRLDLVVEAEGHLTAAKQRGISGRYQYDAAIQSVHVQSPITGRTNHEALATLYVSARAPQPFRRGDRGSGCGDGGGR